MAIPTAYPALNSALNGALPTRYRPCSVLGSTVVHISVPITGPYVPNTPTDSLAERVSAVVSGAPVPPTKPIVVCPACWADFGERFLVSPR